MKSRTLYSWFGGAFALSSLHGCAASSAHDAQTTRDAAVTDATAPSAVLADAGASTRCATGVMRAADESEGPEMMPGRACNACHALSNSGSGEADAPIFAVAGTLYGAPHEADGCIERKAQGASVVVTDARGMTFTAVANASGNFTLEMEGFKLPLQAKVLFQGRQRAMVEAQNSGDCNACHTAQGSSGAPGRIELP